MKPLQEISISILSTLWDWRTREHTPTASRQRRIKAKHVLLQQAPHMEDLVVKVYLVEAAGDIFAQPPETQSASVERI